MIYAHDADKARAFFRDVLEWPSVDAGHGWLIFAMPPSEVGVHPILPSDTMSHVLYLMCEDVHAVVKKLEKLGFQCAPIRDQGFGLVTSFELPGGGPLGMYQPKHPIAAGKKKRKSATSPSRKAGGTKKKPASKKKPATSPSQSAKRTNRKGSKASRGPAGGAKKKAASKKKAAPKKKAAKKAPKKTAKPAKKKR